MHFWIDKRSNYGIGHNRSMAGVSYQHRRIRSKSIVTPIRQHPPPCVPSTSQHYAKSHHLHHHRNRHVELDHRLPASRIPHHPTPESSSSQSNPLPINIQQIVVHSVYPRPEVLPINHVVDSLDSTRSGITSHWLPIYLKGGICVATAIILLTIKFYYDNYMTGLELLTFGSMSIALLIFSSTIVILRMRKKRLTLSQRIQQELFAEPVIEPTINNQMTTVTLDEPIDLPPPYAVAIRLPEKQSTIDCSPPPSYEKINMI